MRTIMTNQTKVIEFYQKSELYSKVEYELVVGLVPDNDDYINGVYEDLNNLLKENFSQEELEGVDVEQVLHLSHF